MPELTPELTAATRLAIIETEIQYIKKGQDDMHSLLKEHVAAQCTGSCDTAKKVVELDTALKTYKKWTWATFASVLMAGLSTLFK